MNTPPFSRVLVSSGPTREYLDEVRFLSNRATGRFGFALAVCAANSGATVTLVAGPTPVPPPVHPRITTIEVVSAIDMHVAVAAAFPHADCFLSVGAVADYRPAHRHAGKWKKVDTPLALDLLPNPDILALMGRTKRPGQTLIGFALEVQDAEAQARAKLAAKRCEAMVLNRPDNFGEQAGGCVLLTASEAVAIPGGAGKPAMAAALWEAIVARFAEPPATR